jgi:hypothetical protein
MIGDRALIDEGARAEDEIPLFVRNDREARSQ